MALFAKAQTGFFQEDPALDETLAQAETILRGMAAHPAKEWMLAMVLMLAAEPESRKGNLELVERHFRESTAILNTMPSAFLPWVACSRLLIMLEMDLEPELAQQEYDKVVSILRQSHSSRMAAMTESVWGHKMRHEGNFKEALAIYRRMLVEWRELGHRAAMANILENMAFVDRVQERSERGVILLGAAERIREANGQDMLRLEREEYERELANKKEPGAAGAGQLVGQWPGHVHRRDYLHGAAGERWPRHVIYWSRYFTSGKFLVEYPLIHDSESGLLPKWSPDTQ